MNPHFINDEAGETAHLGVAEMRLLLSATDTDGALAAGEFRGRAGPWTLPHVHRELDEFFYVVDGVFRFTYGDEEMAAKPGAFLMVPRGTTHVFTAVTPATVLVLWTPGGLEQMFMELGRLPSHSITDPAVRAEISQRYDSIPV